MDKSLCKRLRLYLKRSELFEVEDGSPATGEREEGEESDRDRRKSREVEENSSSSESSASSSASSSSTTSASSASGRKRHKRRKKKSKKTKKRHSRHKKKKSRSRKKRSSRDEDSDNESVKSNMDKLVEETEEQEEEPVEIVDLANQYPPCIRAIFIDSSLDDDQYADIKLGSLFLIPYTGGLIGRAAKCVISFPKAKLIENEHVKVEYDMKKKVYLIKGDLDRFTNVSLSNIL